jgi:hypothetical protein
MQPIKLSKVIRRDVKASINVGRLKNPVLSPSPIRRIRAPHTPKEHVQSYRNLARNRWLFRVCHTSDNSDSLGACKVLTNSVAKAYLS